MNEPRHWRDVVMDKDLQRSETRAPRRSVAISYPTGWHKLLIEAAKKRDISLAAYARRAIMAFVLHDLGREWSEIADQDQAIRPFGANARGLQNVTLAPGADIGLWKIKELE